MSTKDGYADTEASYEAPDGPQRRTPSSYIDPVDGPQGERPDDYPEEAEDDELCAECHDRPRTEHSTYGDLCTHCGRLAWLEDKADDERDEF